MTSRKDEALHDYGRNKDLYEEKEKELINRETLRKTHCLSKRSVLF
jgi:hypothetical protein